jgi:hypothetical protein
VSAATVVIILLVLAMTAGTGFIADRKGRSFLGWAAIGFFLGLIGLLLAIVVSPKKPSFQE